MRGIDMSMNRVRAWLACAAVVLLWVLVFAPVPVLAAEGAQWRITATTEPTHVAAGSSEARLIVTATNVGGAATSGPITITDTLGAGLVVANVAEPVVGFDTFGSGQAQDGVSEGLRAPLACESVPAVKCTYEKAVDTGDQVVMVVTFSAASARNGESIANVASVSGGGAQPASASTPITISSTPAPFGPAPGKRDGGAIDESGGRASRSDDRVHARHEQIVWCVRGREGHPL